MTWLAKTLAISVRNDEMYCKCTLLLFVVSVYAEFSPATFANFAREKNLEPLLAEVIRYHDWVPGRVAAVRLIGYLNKITTDTVEALHQTLLDVQEVQQAAMDTFTRLRRIEGEMFDKLIKNLNNESASIAYTSAQVLALLGKNETTKPEQRKRILKALADVVHSPNARRGIYEMVGSGFSKDDPFRVEYRGRLNQALFQALLDVAGV